MDTSMKVVTRKIERHVNPMRDYRKDKSDFLKESIKNISSRRIIVQ